MNNGISIQNYILQKFPNLWSVLDMTTYTISQLPRIPSDTKDKLDELVTYAETLDIVRKGRNNKSPCPDGFTNEFF